MKLLTLILMLANGETERTIMPAWECRQVEMTLERAWADGGVINRDTDSVLLVGVRCDLPSFVDLITLPSQGLCEVEA